MKASTVFAVLAASVVSAQLDQLPQCALTCAFQSLGSTGCAQADIKCICSASAFVASLTPCVQAACSPAEFEKTLQAAGVLCSQAGASLALPTASITSAAASASSAASSVLEYASSSAASSSSAVYSSISSVASSLSSVYANATMATMVPVPTGNATVTGGPSGTGITVPTQSGNSAGRNVIAIGSFGAAVVAVAAAVL